MASPEAGFYWFETATLELINGLGEQQKECHLLVTK